MPTVETLRRILYADPVWAAYAIADLQPGLADRCRWFAGTCSAGCGEDGGPATGEGLILLYSGLEPPVLFAAGPAQAVADALRQASDANALPAAVYLSLRHEHEAVAGRWYDVAGSNDRRLMYRMVLRNPARILHAQSATPVRLHADDAPRLQRLYGQGGPFAPDAFAPDQLENGVFYGIEEGHGHPAELLAAGGTHIVDWGAGIGAIGNFYTRPDVRRRGYAGALLAAVVQELRVHDIDTIVLNVDQHNANAQGLYDRYGFVVHCPFLEGIVPRV